MSETNFTLPSHDELFSMAEKASDILDNEHTSYRPDDRNGNPGALLDFSKDTLPLIIVPDLHARPKFIENLLSYNINLCGEELSVLNALKENKVRIVCVGDLLHSEKTGERWSVAYTDYLNGNFSGQAMKEEMSEGLSLMMKIFQLKIEFPENFHFLKGNHENIMNQTGGGNFGFRKYAEEGSMVKHFIRDVYGDDVLFIISCWEGSLPLVYVAPNCVVSHAEPYRAFNRDEVINARESEAVVAGLTWTDNNSAKAGSVEEMIFEFIGQEKSEDAVYFAGHRAVKEKYRAWYNNKFIQIHNPLNQNVIVLHPNEKFDFEKNIIEVSYGR